MQPSKPPSGRYDTATIANMSDGDVRWTVPWAMMVNEQGDCYLNGQMSAHDGPGGTVQMRVVRTGDGYVVELVPGEHYRPSRGIPWVGATVADLIPVAEFADAVD